MEINKNDINKKEKQKENEHIINVETYNKRIDSALNNQKQNIILGIANKQLTVLEASKILKTSVDKVLGILKQVEDEDLKEKLKPIIMQYGHTENKSNVLSSLSSKTKKEIILMSLTYRVSKSNLCRLFNTTMEDVDKLWNEFVDFRDPLHFLNLETINESEKLSEYAYKSALKYWKTRNEYVRVLKNAKKNNDQEKVQYMQDKLKELHEEIDDTIINEISMTKNDPLTEKQIEKIARFRLKYSLSVLKCERALKKHHNTIMNCCKYLAEKDPIYAIKLAELNENNTLKSIEYITENDKQKHYYPNIESLKR